MEITTMRILLTIVIFLTAAAAVDELWFDGRYRHPLWQEANGQDGWFAMPVPNLSDLWRGIHR
jgi:hypothetical protein